MTNAYSLPGLAIAPALAGRYVQRRYLVVALLEKGHVDPLNSVETRYGDWNDPQEGDPGVLA